MPYQDEPERTLDSSKWPSDHDIVASNLPSAAPFVAPNVACCFRYRAGVFACQPGSAPGTGTRCRQPPTMFAGETSFTRADGFTMILWPSTAYASSFISSGV